jgi:hypothetical protein
MASSGERRMVFDTRGRRKHVIRFVYAILAILMGASLFLVVGPVNIGSLLGNQTSSGNAAKVFEEQAERIEGRLAKNPTDEALLLSLTRARINAANAQVETDPATGAKTTPLEAHENFGVAARAWARYLKQAGGEPSPSAAQLVAATYFVQAETGGRSFGEVEESIQIATTAQRIAAERLPSLGSIGTLAKYQYYNGEFAAADKSTKQAAAKATSKTEAKAVEKQLAEFRKSAKEFAKRKKQAAKVEREVGKEKLTNPFSGLTGPGSTPGGE